jgi:RNA polymerase sigma-70 factor (ECF subfamily)
MERATPEAGCHTRRGDIIAHDSEGAAVDEQDDGTLAKAVAGDQAALSRLLERFGAEVASELRISPKWRGIVDADDVMQVTYLEAFLGIRGFKPGGPGAFKAWLRRIAEHNLLDAIKEVGRLKRPQPAHRAAPTPASSDETYIALVESLTGTTVSPSGVAAAAEVHRVVEVALEALPPDYATVVRLHDIQGMSGPEVAAAMGRSSGAVRMLLARARERLREALGSTSRYFTR